MTKPTGRPRGRPKEKEYVTLMARVPKDLADRVKGYRGRKQQTMSYVLRDGLELLLDQEHAQAPLYVHDRKGEKPSIMSDTKEGSANIMSDRKEAVTVNMSDTKEEHAGTPRRTRSTKMSDMKVDKTGITSDTKGDVSPMMSDTKEVQTASTAEPAILSDNNMPVPPVLTRLSEMRASGLSFQQIADRLNAEGVPTISGKGAWNKGTVSKQLGKHQAQPA